MSSSSQDAHIKSSDNGGNWFRDRRNGRLKNVRLSLWQELDTEDSDDKWEGSWERTNIDGDENSTASAVGNECSTDSTTQKSKIEETPKDKPESSYNLRKRKEDKPKSITKNFLEKKMKIYNASNRGNRNEEVCVSKGHITIASNVADENTSTSSSKTMFDEIYGGPSSSNRRQTVRGRRVVDRNGEYDSQSTEDSLSDSDNIDVTMGDPKMHNCWYYAVAAVLGMDKKKLCSETGIAEGGLKGGTISDMQHLFKMATNVDLGATAFQTKKTMFDGIFKLLPGKRTARFIFCYADKKEHGKQDQPKITGHAVVFRVKKL